MSNPRIIDLRTKTIAQAKRIMKRLKAFQKAKEITRPIHFLLPNRDKANKRSSFQQEAIITKCPYCQSRLVDSESGWVCSGENLRDIIYDIERVKRHPLYSKNPELYLSNRANRFYDYYMLQGRGMTCDYVLGNEERRFRINNRLLRPGVDRKKIKK